LKKKMIKERFWASNDGGAIFCKSKASFYQENNYTQFVYLTYI